MGTCSSCSCSSSLSSTTTDKTNKTNKTTTTKDCIEVFGEMCDNNEFGKMKTWLDVHLSGTPLNSTLSSNRCIFESAADCAISKKEIQRTRREEEQREQGGLHCHILSLEPESVLIRRRVDISVLLDEKLLQRTKQGCRKCTFVCSASHRNAPIRSLIKCSDCTTFTKLCLKEQLSRLSLAADNAQTTHISNKKNVLDICNELMVALVDNRRFDMMDVFFKTVQDQCHAPIPNLTNGCFQLYKKLCCLILDDGKHAELPISVWTKTVNCSLKIIKKYSQLFSVQLIWNILGDVTKVEIVNDHTQLTEKLFQKCLKSIYTPREMVSNISTEQTEQEHVAAGKTKELHSYSFQVFRILMDSLLLRQTAHPYQMIDTLSNCACLEKWHHMFILREYIWKTDMRQYRSFDAEIVVSVLIRLFMKKENRVKMMHYLLSHCLLSTNVKEIAEYAFTMSDWVCDCWNCKRQDPTNVDNVSFLIDHGAPILYALRCAISRRNVVLMDKLLCRYSSSFSDNVVVTMLMDENIILSLEETRLPVLECLIKHGAYLNVEKLDQDKQKEIKRHFLLKTIIMIDDITNILLSTMFQYRSRAIRPSDQRSDIQYRSRVIRSSDFQSDVQCHTTRDDQPVDYVHDDVVCYSFDNAFPVIVLREIVARQLGLEVQEVNEIESLE